MDLESAARELKMLAGRERLTPSDLDRAKNLMVQLKRTGMANQEIVELTGSRWSESTIKGYTKGVRATSPESWKSATALFSEMQSRNLTLDDVNQAMVIVTELDGMGSSLGDVISFMENLNRKGTNVGKLMEAIDLQTQLESTGSSLEEIAGFLKELEIEDIDVPTIISLLRDWHETGLTSADALSVLSYKSQLVKAGLDIDTMSYIAKAAGEFGSSREVLKAVAGYSKLEELGQEAQKRQEGLDAQAAEMESRNLEIGAADKKLKEIRGEIAAKEKALAIYERLKTMGFNEKTLSELDKAAGKFGTLRQVLEAINQFIDLAKLKATNDKLSRETVRAKTKLAEMEGKIQTLKEAYTEQSARHKTMLDQFEILNTRAVEMGREIGKVEQQLEQDTMACDILHLLQNPGSADYGQCLPVVLVMVKSIGVWASENKSQFKYYPLIVKDLGELLQCLGGV
jgi:hypothetical protein